jgi:hypothetical protein
VQHATLLGRYATRLGSWLLHGELGRTPKLCALDIDPACAVDLFAERTPVDLDAETRAALTVWGDIPE